ncbi:hypothetical protein VPNG_04867 [Cytospora leucostoma]|uniref:2EXR domain-containing protein n=1 Tax=Cytospora leucostoma TaxID=1230097 RepID=A0A423XBA8_9PEZI|nr:hypothetical protein VPNG_04867 [Cytospora leucostoma]
MPRPNDDTFPQFRNLPTEVRLMVWSLAHQDLKEDHSAGVCVLNRTTPPKYGVAAVDPDLPCVDIPFPHLMHACAESRASVLSVRANVQFRYSPEAGCNIACRALDPELDTVYLSHANFDAAMAQTDYFGGHEPRINKVAIEACVFFESADYKIRHQIMPKFPGLREFKIVLKSETLGVKAQSPFAPPTQRFELVEINSQTREIQRWLLHLRLKAHQLNPAALGTGYLPQASFLAPMGPLLAHGPLIDTPEFKAYVFHTAIRGKRGQTVWKKYPLARSAESGRRRIGSQSGCVFGMIR